jgi:hypothetical protein
MLLCVRVDTWIHQDADDPNQPLADDPSKTEESVRAAKAYDAMSNVEWWGFMHVLQKLACLLGFVMDWFHACPCHPYDFCTDNDIKREMDGCPMRGMRASDLATGVLEPFIQRVATSVYSELLNSLQNLSSEQRRKVLVNWFVGKDFVYVEICLRIQCYGELPLKVMCLGHLSMDEVRTGLAICVLLFDNLEADSPAFENEVVVELFDRRLELRRHVEMVISGDLGVHEVPRLMALRMRARFALTIEVSVERLHALLHKNIKLASFHNGAFASIMSRKHEILNEISHDRARLDHFAALVAEVASPSHAIRTLKLEHHPRILDFHVDDAMPRDLPHKVAVEVIYRCDLLTQFADEPYVEEPPSPPSDPPDAFDHGGGGGVGDHSGGRPFDPAQYPDGDPGGVPTPLFPPGAADESGAVPAVEPLDAAPPEAPHLHVHVEGADAAIASEAAVIPPIAALPHVAVDDDMMLLALIGHVDGAAVVAPELVVDIVADAPVAIAPVGFVESICRAHALPHFRSAASFSKIYSLHVSSFHTGLPFKSFDAVMKPPLRLTPDFEDLVSRSGLNVGRIVCRASSSFDVEEFAMEADVGVMFDKDSADSAAIAGEVRTDVGNVFFRLSEMEPAKICTGGRTHLTSDSVVVKFLSVVCVDSEKHEVIVVEPSHVEQHVFDRHDIEAAFGVMRVWQSDPRESYWPCGFNMHGRPDLFRALNAMRNVTRTTTVDLEDYVTFDIQVDHEHSAALDQLESEGLVSCAHRTAAVSSWVFTPQGLDRLQFAHVLIAPTDFCKPRENISVQNMSMVELVFQLKVEGWAVQLWNMVAKVAHAGRAPAFNAATGKPKVWWIVDTAKTICVAYLKCLLLARSLGLSELLHLRPSSYYVDILKLASKMARARAMTMAIEGDGSLVGLADLEDGGGGCGGGGGGGDS